MMTQLDTIQANTMIIGIGLILLWVRIEWIRTKELLAKINEEKVAE